MEFYSWSLAYVELLLVFIRPSFMESNILSLRKCSTEKIRTAIRGRLSSKVFLKGECEHETGSNAKLNFDGCPLLHWSRFLHNKISRIVLAWEIQPYLSVTSNLSCARRQVCSMKFLRFRKSTINLTLIDKSQKLFPK